MPVSSMAANWPLTLTVASGEDLPLTGTSDWLTAVLSSGEETSRKSSRG